jgi:hypothetical protein
VQIKDGKIVVNGFPAAYVLKRRVATTKINNSAAETAIRGLITAMDPWPKLSLGDEAGITDVFEGEISGVSLYEYVQTICQAADAGYRIIKSGDALNFQLYKPTLNERAKYSTDYGNLGEICRTISDVNYFNVATVLGEDSNGVQITVAAGDTAATGANRHEMIVQGDSLEDGETLTAYKLRLAEQGKAALAVQAKIDSITFTIDDDRAELGDIITVLLPDLGISIAVRVTGLTIKSQNNRTTKTVEVGDPIKKTRRA